MCDARLWCDVERPDGWTNAIATITAYDTIEQLARDLLDQYQGDMIPIGFSMGAIVALMMAKLAPDRIVGLVLSSTNCTADLPDRSRARLLQQASAKTGQLDRVVRDELKPHYLSPHTKGARRTAVLDLTLAMGLDLGPDVFVRQSEALRTRPSLCEVLDAIKVPSLIIAGKDDTLCPPAWHKAMAARSALAHYVEISQAGHLVPLEAPAVFSKTIAQWLANQGETTKGDIL